MNERREIQTIIRLSNNVFSFVMNEVCPTNVAFVPFVDLKFYFDILK